MHILFWTISAFKNPQAFQLHVHVQDEWNWIQPKYCTEILSAIVYDRDWFSESKKLPFFMDQDYTFVAFLFLKMFVMVYFPNL